MTQKEAKPAAKEKAKKEAKEAEEKAKREAKEAKEKAKREAKESKERIKRKAAEAKEAKQAREAKEKAKREAKEAKERAKREAAEAKEAKRAEEKAKKEGEKRGAEEEAEPAVVTKLYKGVVELTIMPPVDLGQLENLEKDLRQVENLRLVLVGGSVDEGNRIVVSAEEPIPLLRILKEMPAVEQVVRKSGKTQVTLKTK